MGSDAELSAHLMGSEKAAHAKVRDPHLELRAAVGWHQHIAAGIDQAELRGGEREEGQRDGDGQGTDRGKEMAGRGATASPRSTGWKRSPRRQGRCCATGRTSC